MKIALIIQQMLNWLFLTAAQGANHGHSRALLKIHMSIYINQDGSFGTHNGKTSPTLEQIVDRILALKT